VKGCGVIDQPRGRHIIMQLVNFTLYEVFGYVLPGAFGLAGVYLLYWPFFLAPDQDWTGISAAGWTGILAVAYVFGHFLQAVMNLLLKEVSWRPERRIFDDHEQVPANVRSTLEKRVREALGLTGNGILKPKTIYHVAEHHVLQHGKTEARDVYQYREGFYRGMAPALLLLGIGCVVRLHGPEGSLRVVGMQLYFTIPALLCGGVLAVGIAIFSFLRYLRFAGYRVRYAYYSYLVMTGGQAPGDRGKEPPKEVVASPDLDVHSTLRITAEEAVRGARVPVLLPDGRESEVNVPARVEDGTRLRLAGQGIVKKGDLCLHVRVIPEAGKGKE